MRLNADAISFDASFSILAGTRPSTDAFAGFRLAVNNMFHRFTDNASQ